MSQPSLFDTGIVCDHCGKDPEHKPNNPVLWNGFKDADTGQHVCSECRRKHYADKYKTAHGGKYSEVPMVIVTEKLNAKK